MGEATIYRDSYGVPHIYADTDAEAVYALGYAQAQDRLEALLTNMRMAKGELAEVLGPDHLENDRLQRLLRIAETTHACYESLSVDVRALVESYAAGVNCFLQEHPDAAPAWAAPIEPTDVLAITHWLVQSWSLGLARADLSKREQNSKAAPSEIPHNSNQWAVAPTHSAEGCATLYIDPHVPWNGVYRWYEAHLHGDNLHVAGFTLAGCPFIVLGYSDHVAWTVTAGGADSGDVCEEQLDGAYGDRYRYGDGWRPVETVTTTIRVREGDAIRDVEHVMRYTHHGPIILEEGDRAYSFRSPFADEVGTLEEFYRMDCAQDLASFKDALAQRCMISQNVMAADTEGNLFYVQYGRCPRRPLEFPSDRPIPGWLPEAEWGDPVPFEELPQIENPPHSHVMQNCNVAAYLTTPEHRIDHTAYPPYVLHGHVGDFYRPRGYRATYLLHREGIIGLEEARRIAMDSYIVAAEPWVAALLKAEQAESQACPDTTAQRQEALAILRAWDGYARRESVGPAIFRFWRLEYHKARPHVTAETEHLHIPRTPEDQRAALEALDRAIRYMLDKHGRLDVSWGEVQRLRRGDQSWPLSGDAFAHLGGRALRATEGGDPAEDGRFYCVAGNSCSTLAFMKRPVEAYSITPFGQSDDPNSPHFCDQAPLFSGEQFKPMWYAKELLMQHVESELRLQVPARA